MKIVHKLQWEPLTSCWNHKCDGTGLFKWSSGLATHAQKDTLNQEKATEWLKKKEIIV